jgi:16S rRNA (guanine966-N2)-methyltransferase
VTRIVAGAAGGRQLRVPPGSATRPTSDRAREGLFSTLTSLVGDLTGRAFLDLYAGSGAVGLEALSRGAAHVLLVESAPKAVRTLRDNVAALGLPGAVVRGEPVARALTGQPPAAYDVAFADPPYATPADDVVAVVDRLVTGGWLAPDAVVAVERASRDEPWRWPPGIIPVRERRYGEATIWYGRAAPGG